MEGLGGGRRQGHLLCRPHSPHILLQTPRPDASWVPFLGEAEGRLPGTPLLRAGPPGLVHLPSSQQATLASALSEAPPSLLPSPLPTPCRAVATPSFQLLRPRALASSLPPLSLSHPTSSLSGFPVGSVFKIHQQFRHFSPRPLPPSCPGHRHLAPGWRPQSFRPFSSLPLASPPPFFPRRVIS